MSLKNILQGRKIITIGIIIILVLLLSARFSPWRIVEAHGTNEDYYQQYDYGLFSTKQHLAPAEPQTTNNHDMIDYYSTHNVSDDAPAIILLKGLVLTDVLCIISIASTIIFLVVWLTLKNENKLKIHLIFSIITTVLIASTFLYYVSLFPLGTELESFSIYGSTEWSHWGPGIGFYLCIFALIINIMLIFLIYKLKNVSQQREPLEREQIPFDGSDP